MTGPGKELEQKATDKEGDEGPTGPMDRFKGFFGKHIGNLDKGTRSPPIRLAILALQVTASAYALAVIVFEGVREAFYRALDIVGLYPATQTGFTIFSTLLVILVAIMIFARPKNKGRQLAGFVAIIALGAPLLMQATGEPPHDLVVVYDAASPMPAPRNLSDVKSYPLPDILKVAQVGEISSSATFLSTIHNPSANWHWVFQAGFSPREPILSLQEVLGENDGRFIDISYSRFDGEITSFIRSRAQQIEEIIIFFDRDYVDAERRLRLALLESMPDTPVTSIIFEEATRKLATSDDTTIVYLGPPERFLDFVNLAEDAEYAMSIAPNWVRPTISPIESIPDSRDFVIMSSIYEDVAAGELERWGEILGLVREARERDLDIQRFISNELINDRTVVHRGY